RTWNGKLAESPRTSVSQMLPAPTSTSTSPYRAEPAVSGSANTRVSSCGFCLRAIIGPAWHERTENGKKPAYGQRSRRLSSLLVGSTHRGVPHDDEDNRTARKRASQWARRLETTTDRGYAQA